MSENKIRVGISQGDINGIGLEVILKTVMNPTLLELCTPILFGSQKTVSYHRKALGIEDFSFNPVRDLEAINHKRANIFNCYEEEVSIELGKATEVAGRYALKSLEAACDALEKKKIDVLVTAPINKHTIQSDNFKFVGHTEYLEQKFGKNGSLMLMVADTLKVALVTGHLPIEKVAAAITTEKIIQKATLLHRSLLEDFGIRKPKIAVLGLNPHAGDNGTIGNAEETIIKPAIQKLREKDVFAFGPYAADGFFGSGAYTGFDGVLAMYHDQGLIPFKTISFNDGVNFTAGLPVIRTSPDHGTAYDIAGKNKADESSFRKAIYLACDIFRTRNQYAEISANPLKINPIKRER